MTKTISKAAFERMVRRLSNSVYFDADHTGLSDEEHWESWNAQHKRLFRKISYSLIEAAGLKVAVKNGRE